MTNIWEINLLTFTLKIKGGKIFNILKIDTHVGTHTYVRTYLKTI